MVSDTRLEQTHLDLRLPRQASYLCTHLSDFLNLNVFIYKMEIVLPTF